MSQGAGGGRPRRPPSGGSWRCLIQSAVPISHLLADRFFLQQVLKMCPCKCKTQFLIRVNSVSSRRARGSTSTEQQALIGGLGLSTQTGF